MQYADFVLEIKEDGGGALTVRVLASSAGDACETVAFPFEGLQLQNRLLKLKNAILGSARTQRRVVTPAAREAEDFGQQLFDTLISGEIRTRYDVSRERARGSAHGLRVKLRVDAPSLAEVPWEFLYDRRESQHLCLSRDTPVVRVTPLVQPIPPLAVEPPLRVLGMIASPITLPALDVDRERARIDAAIDPLRRGGLVELSWVEGSTWRDLQAALQRARCHVFHFIGHGGFDEARDEGYLVLANEHGAAAPLFANRLALLLDSSDLRIVVLNACESATGGARDPTSSAASALVARGVPAVVAMQFAISDEAAIELSRSLYEAVSNGLPVDAAVAEARKAVALALDGTLEWATPVLFMRSSDGVLFRIRGRRKRGGPQDGGGAGPDARADRVKEERLQRKHDRAVARSRTRRSQAERADRDRAERERAERERQDAEVLESARVERLEEERRERERAEREQAKRAEPERVERLEQERRDRERAEREQAKRAERERVERLEEERRERERADREQAAWLEAQRRRELLAQAERVRAARLEEERRARERADREQAQWVEAQRRRQRQAQPERGPARQPAPRAPTPGAAPPETAERPTTPRRAALPLVIIGYLCLLWFGVVGALLGAYLWRARVGPGSDAAFAYDERSRLHGKVMFAIGCILSALTIGWHFAARF